MSERSEEALERPPRAAEPVAPSDPRLVAFARLLGVVDRLRAPDGCAWDREQTLESMAPHLVEEAFEAREAIEEGAREATVEELGDVLMASCLLARIGEDQGRFDLGSVAEAVATKLVRRHPHVFGAQRAGSAGEALASWEAVKQAERSAKAQDASALAGVPRALPALQRAGRISSKARSAGFRWASVAGAIAKVEEEARELAEALAQAGVGTAREELGGGAARARVEHELGDLLVAAAFLASYLGLEPESVARGALARFERRFRAMEGALARPMRETPLPELVGVWARVKHAEGDAQASA